MDSLTVLDALVYGTAVNSAGDEVELLIDVALPALDGDIRPAVVCADIGRLRDVAPRDDLLCAMPSGGRRGGSNSS